jgi:dTDP-4-amino-4,6-dideoxygalactose transaminase
VEHSNIAMTGVSQLLEQALASRLRRKHCVLTGRAASAIYIALKALDLGAGKVVMPTVGCPSPASVTLYSGHHPVFCDVRLQDFNLCPEALRQVLSDHPDVVAIMPVHLYGQAAPMRQILDVAAAHNLPVTL